MQVLRIVFGSVLLAIAVHESAQAFLLFTNRDVRARWLRPRTGASKWRLLATALLDAAVGALLVTGLVRTPTAEWLAVLTASVGARLIRLDLRSWLRSRRERQAASRAGPQAAVLSNLENSGFARRLRAAADGWEALKARRENLDLRVASGEITAETRDLYMKVHRRQLIRSLGYDNPLRWPERFLVSALLPVLDAQAVRLRAELTRRP